MQNSRPDVLLDVVEIRQILSHFGFEVTEDNINSIIRHKTTVLAVGIRTLLEGKMASEWEVNFKKLIALIIASP